MAYQNTDYVCKAPFESENHLNGKLLCCYTMSTVNRYTIYTINRESARKLSFHAIHLSICTSVVGVNEKTIQMCRC